MHRYVMTEKEFELVKSLDCTHLWSAFVLDNTDEETRDCWLEDEEIYELENMIDDEGLPSLPETTPLYDWLTKLTSL